MEILESGITEPRSILRMGFALIYERGRVEFSRCLGQTPFYPP